MPETEKPTAIVRSYALSKIIWCIYKGFDYSQSIARQLNESQPSVFRKLEMLENAGLIERKRMGSEVRFTIVWAKILTLGQQKLALLGEEQKIWQELVGAARKKR